MLRRRAGDGGLEGSVAGARGDSPIEAAAVTGNALFFRLDVGGPVSLCATVEGERMRGRGESQHGDVFAFGADREVGV